MFFVYILKSSKDNKYYIGSTGDLQRRIFEHNTGKVKSTKHRRPLVLTRKECYETLLEARRREIEIKRMKGGIQFKSLLSSAKLRE